MSKWLSNLIIVLLCFIGIQMVSKDIEQKFYFDEVLPPTMNNMEKKETEINEPHLAVQIITVNQALYEEKQKLNNEASMSKAEEKSEVTNQVQAMSKDDTILVALNAMDLNELQTLKGVGPVIAERILEYKKTNGPFKTIEELGEVKGIGTKKLETIEASLRQL